MSGLYLPGEVVPSFVSTTAWQRTPAAYLWSWVRTDHPGYRRLLVAGVPYTIASGTYRWDDYITALQTAVGASVDVVRDATGYIGLDPVGAITFVDRMGWLLGYGSASGVSGTVQSTYVPPGGIPLLGATWDSVTVERERELSQDRSRRQSGYVFGGARVWRCALTMTRYAFEALCSGWCLRGKVSLVGSTSSAMSASTPAGVLSGYVLGLDGAPVWDGPTQEICRATLLVAGTTA